MDDAVLAAHHAAGQEAWPGVTVTREELASELSRRLGAGATPKALAACCGRDVYVMVAAARGDAAAIAAVEALLAKEVERAGPRTSARPDQIADARGAVRELLFTDTPERISGVRSFSGRGDLRGFLRVIATRELVKIVQKGRREQPREQDALVALISGESDPELSILRERYRDAVTGCVRDALGKLGERPRALLRYQLVDRMPIEQLAALYGIHRTTLWRWLEAANTELGTLIRTEVTARLGVARDEVDSIVRLVQSRVELSLQRLMA